MLLFVFVAPPVLGEVSPSFLIQKEGDTVDLFCEASATPQPTLTWFKDNKELRSSDTVVIHGNRVQLRGVVRTDGGVYSCIFKNTVGRVSHIIKLIIEGKCIPVGPPPCTSTSQTNKHSFINNVYMWSMSKRAQ